MAVTVTYNLQAVRRRKIEESTPLTGPKAEAGKATFLDQMPEGFDIQWLRYLILPAAPMRKGILKPQV